MCNKKSMTKKAWKEVQKSQRVLNGFNTGTRTMKSAKHPTRQERKKIVWDQTGTRPGAYVSKFILDFFFIVCYTVFRKRGDQDVWKKEFNRQTVCRTQNPRPL